MAASISAAMFASTVFFLTSRLGLPTGLPQLLLQGADLLDDRVALGEGLDHVGLGDLLGPRLHHDDGVLGPGHQQVQLALGPQVGGRGVDHALPVPIPTRTAATGLWNGMSEM